MEPFRGYTPVYKTYIAKVGGRTAMWTPAASARIVLSQLVVSTSNTTTFRIDFGNGGNIVMDHWAQGSVMVYPLSDAWVEGQIDQPLMVSFGVTSGAAENTFVSAQGYEDRP